MKNYIFIIPIFISFAILSFAQENNESVKLFPVFVKGKYGYITEKGEMVIKPQFDKANKFNSGLALVEIESKNISDIPGRYDYILGKQGYIDQTGKFIIKPGRYESAEDFSEGLAGVRVSNCKREYCNGYIDTTGKLVIKPQFQTVGKFQNGTAAVRMPDDNWGVIDKEGKFIIPPNYDATLPFFENVGIALVLKNKQESPFDQQLSDFEAVFYDRNGIIISRPQNLVFGWFNEGLVSIITESGFGFIDKFGKIIIKPRFEKAKYFLEGLCPVRINKKWGFIDKQGNFLIEPQFKEAYSFSEGLARVLTNEGYGFINRDGKMAIKPQDWFVSNFEDGLAFAQQGNMRGYINKTGKFIWKNTVD